MTTVMYLSGLKGYLGESGVGKGACIGGSVRSMI